MRVCHVTSVHPPFDARIFHRECLSLARAGHEVTILAPADFGERVVDRVRVLGVPPARSRRQRLRVWIDILRRLKDQQPDVVHFHDPELLLLARRFRPARLIYDSHEYLAEGMLTRPWLPKPLRKPLALLMAPLEPMLARQVDGIIVASPGQVDRIAVAKRPVRVLHNFPLPSAEPPRHSSDGRTLIHVGAHAEVRGCRDMIEALTYVRLRIPEARLLLVGPFNHRPYEADMRRLMRERGLEEAVHLTGPVPYESLPQWMARADVGLMAIRPTAQHVGGIPTKIFDYMMAGLPVVASDLPEARRFLTEAECGLLIQPGDPEALGTAIVALLEDPELMKIMGAKGRQAYEQRFNWAHEEKKLLTLYDDLAACAVPRAGDI